MEIQPLQLVGATTATYLAAFVASRFSDTIFRDPTISLKAISSFHSIVTVICGAIALSQPWPLNIWDAIKQPPLKPGRLDDHDNLMIHGHNAFGMAVCALETGFLLYDTMATLTIHYQQYCFKKQMSWVDATILLLRKEPVTLWHHLTIITALGYFQIYTIKGQERGFWIMVLFVLMNASTPFMQLRWWKRQKTGHSTLTLDIMFCVVFGMCRLGTMLYMFHRYGQYHGISTVQAFARQDWICQISTGSLFALNAVWWATLVKNTTRKVIRSLQ